MLAVSQLPENSVDAIITDSPYGLGKEPDAVKCLQDWIDHGYHEIKGSGFMGKSWDAFVPQPRLWKECFRVLKPGGHLLSFFGTRTYDWGTLAIRLAGFEIRDQIMWLYGSGFPKSLDISKAIDKRAGAEREVIGKSKYEGRRPNKFGGKNNGDMCYGDYKAQPEMPITAPTTEQAKKWDGFGTALKPACEPICVARKPLEGTVVNTVLKYGTGGIDINESRIPFIDDNDKAGAAFGSQPVINGGKYGAGGDKRRTYKENIEANDKGRFPSNVILDPEAAELLDAQSGFSKSTKSANRNGVDNGAVFALNRKEDIERGFNDSGGASRFFYCAKASPRERTGRKHPTIKPVALMEYLIKMFCPKEGLVLDPHFGTGTTGAGCINTSRNFIGIDADPEAIKEAVDFLGTYNLASFGNKIEIKTVCDQKHGEKLPGRS